MDRCPARVSAESNKLRTCSAPPTASELTGASGYVGRHVLNRLAGDGRPLRAMIRARSSAHIPGGVEVVGADLTRPESLGEALRAADVSGGDPDGSGYYRHWLAALERLVSAKGIASPETLADRRAAWDRAAHVTGQTINVDGGFVMHW